MWKNVASIIISIVVAIFFIYIAYQVGVKGDFKHTHIRNEWIKNIEPKEFNKFKTGFGLSYLLLGIIVITLVIASNPKIIAMCIILIALTAINLFRIAVKYMYLK